MAGFRANSIDAAAASPLGLESPSPLDFGTGSAEGGEQLRPADEVFVPTADIDDDGAPRVAWSFDDCCCPYEKRTSVEIVEEGIVAGASDWHSEAGPVTDRLREASYEALPLFFGLGLLLAATPCVFPMVPILSGTVTADSGATSRRAFELSSVHVPAMSATYAGLGALATVSGANLRAVFQPLAVLVAFAALSVAMAPPMFGLYEVQVPNAVRTRLAAASGSSRWGRWGCCPR